MRKDVDNSMHIIHIKKSLNIKEKKKQNNFLSTDYFPIFHFKKASYQHVIHKIVSLWIKNVENVET